MVSTFLRQHATIACRTNKPVYTARFLSHVFVALTVLKPNNLAIIEKRKYYQRLQQIRIDPPAARE